MANIPSTYRKFNKSWAWRKSLAWLHRNTDWRCALCFCDLYDGPHGVTLVDSHHIIPVSEVIGPVTPDCAVRELMAKWTTEELLYSPVNVLPLCNPCHVGVHKEYRRGPDQKHDCISRLLGIAERRLAGETLERWSAAWHGK